MNDLFSNVKPGSKKLYISNLKRLNNGQEIDLADLSFLSNPDQILQNLHDKGYKLTTIRSYFIAACSLLSVAPHYKELYTQYYKILTSQNKTLAVNNTKSPVQQENWMTYEEVLVLQHLMQEEAVHSNNFNTILDWVILSLYTLTPPRRILDYTEMLVITEGLPEDEIINRNFWIVDKKKFVFNNYKTSGTYKTQIIDIPDALDFVLKKYLEHRRLGNEGVNKSGPLLQSIDGSPITKNYTVTKRLNQIFGKNISVNMLRNIYLTSAFKDDKIKLSKIATDMGTSPSTIQNHYIKLDD